MKAPYSYDLPSEQIAQRPVLPYDSARLMLVDRASGKIESSVFRSLADFVRPQDLFVFNNTKVVPARLFGNFAGGGSLEILLIERRGEGLWLCLGKPLKKFLGGRELHFAHGLRARVKERVGEQRVMLEFLSDGSDSAEVLLRRCGVMPIPPYIRGGAADGSDSEDYQTFFAEHEGSVAAPTASLHFTPALMQTLRDKGCGIEFVTLHLGTASFLPLWNEGQDAARDLTPPGTERGFFHSALLPAIESRRRAGGRVIAVGTSVVRLLESAARLSSVPEGIVEVRTDLFIRPGFEFELVDAMVTNFHQPRTTHLLLVEAFMGEELLQRSYAQALDSRYRFLSYGDGMFVS